MHNVLAIVMVLDEKREDVAERLRRVADKIERGDTFEEALSDSDRALVRASDSRDRGELALAGRYFGVSYDGSETIDAPHALFSHESDAESFANGARWDDEDRPSTHGIVHRCDVMMASWNGSPDEEPIKESDSAVARR